jgi:hypothetical protein
LARRVVFPGWRWQGQPVCGVAMARPAGLRGGDGMADGLRGDDGEADCVTGDVGKAGRVPEWGCQGRLVSGMAMARPALLRGDDGKAGRFAEGSHLKCSPGSEATTAGWSSEEELTLLRGGSPTGLTMGEPYGRELTPGRRAGIGCMGQRPDRQCISTPPGNRFPRRVGHDWRDQWWPGGPRSHPTSRGDRCVGGEGAVARQRPGPNDLTRADPADPGRSGPISADLGRSRPISADLG